MKKPTDFHPILDFLRDLNLHNEKAWFDLHRPAYEQARAGFEVFIDSLIDEAQDFR